MAARRDHLVEKQIVNAAGVRTTVHVRPDQAANLAVGPLREVPPPATTRGPWHADPGWITAEAGDALHRALDGDYAPADIEQQVADLGEAIDTAADDLHPAEAEWARGRAAALSGEDSDPETLSGLQGIARALLDPDEEARAARLVWGHAIEGDAEWADQSEEEVLAMVRAGAPAGGYPPTGDEELDRAYSRVLEDDPRRDEAASGAASADDAPRTEERIQSMVQQAAAEGRPSAAARADISVLAARHSDDGALGAALIDANLSDHNNVEADVRAARGEHARQAAAAAYQNRIANDGLPREPDFSEVNVRDAALINSGKSLDVRSTVNGVPVVYTVNSEGDRNPYAHVDSPTVVRATLADGTAVYAYDFGSSAEYVLADGSHRTTWVHPMDESGEVELARQMTPAELDALERADSIATDATFVDRVDPDERLDVADRTVLLLTRLRAAAARG